MIGSRPICDSMIPMPAATTPLSGYFPPRTETSERPRMQRQRNSGEPSISTSGRKIGIDSVSTRQPIRPPMSDAVKAAPMAFPASPRLAIGWPSRIVAVLPAVPGAPIRILGIGPEVKVIDAMPRINGSAEVASMTRQKGSSTARPNRASMPGRTPRTSPKRRPSMNINRCIGENNWANANSAALSSIM